MLRTVGMIAAHDCGALVQCQDAARARVEKLPLFGDDFVMDREWAFDSDHFQVADVMRGLDVREKQVVLASPLILQ